MHAYDSGSVFLLVTNIMIGLALVQFLTIVLNHFLTYTCPYDVMATLYTSRENAIKHFGIRPLEDNYLNADIALLDIDVHDENCNDDD